jgi:hypothetical protein
MLPSRLLPGDPRPGHVERIRIELAGTNSAHLLRSHDAPGLENAEVLDDGGK